MITKPTPTRPAPKSLPSVESLRCFFAAAHHLNFRRVAAEVGLTPTAFSERIRALEQELSAVLFTRTTRRVELTAAGVALVPACERALDGVRACMDAVSAPEPLAVRLRLGTRFELGLSWLVPALIELERSRPSFQVDLYFGSGGDILLQLERGVVDAVVTSAPVARSNWQGEVLHPETYTFVGAARLLRSRALRRPADAALHTLLDVDETLPLARYLMSATPALKFAHARFCGAGAAVLARTLAGDGVAVLPTYMIATHLRSRRLLALLPRIRLLSDSFRLVYRQSSAYSAALGELAAFLRTRPLS